MLAFFISYIIEMKGNLKLVEIFSHLTVAFQMRMVIINLSSGNTHTELSALFQEGTTLLTLLPV